MSLGLVSTVGVAVALVNAGFVAVGVSEVSGSRLAGAVACIVVLVAEALVVRTVKRLMAENAAEAGEAAAVVQG